MKKLIKILIAFFKKLFTNKKQSMSKTPNPFREIEYENTNPRKQKRVLLSETNLKPKQYGEYLQKTGKQIWNKNK